MREALRLETYMWQLLIRPVCVCPCPGRADRSRHCLLDGAWVVALVESLHHHRHLHVPLHHGMQLHLMQLHLLQLHLPIGVHGWWLQLGMMQLHLHLPIMGSMAGGCWCHGMVAVGAMGMVAAAAMGMVAVGVGGHHHSSHAMALLAHPHIWELHQA